MIYVKLSAAFKDGNSGGKKCKDRKYETIIKIGYCGDDKETSRSTIYRTENPTIDTIYIIVGGTPQDEKNLHHHFRKLKAPFGREWFYEDDSIYEFFDTHTTAESLKELQLALSIRDGIRVRKEEKRTREDIERIIFRALLAEGGSVDTKKDAIKLFRSFDDILEEAMKSPDPKDYIKSRFPELNFDVEEPELDEKTRKDLEEFNSTSLTANKYKLLYTLSSDELPKILPHLPISFSKYYFVVGPSRFKALSYQETELEEEYLTVINNASLYESLSELIYSSIEVGKRYSCFDLKQMLKSIYNRIGYKKTPKSTDLKDYFILKDVILVNSGKRIKAFEIVSRK